MWYRRNADERIRELERGAEGPFEQARLLAVRLRVGQISEEQIKVAACLGHPAALVLFPEEKCENYFRDIYRHPKMCANLGDEIQSKIHHLPLQGQAEILLTIVIFVLDSLTLEKSNRGIQGAGYIKPVIDQIQNAREIIAAGFSNEDEAHEMMYELRGGSAQFEGIILHQAIENGIPIEQTSLYRVLGRALALTNVFYELVVGDGEQYRAVLSLQAFFREACQLAVYQLDDEPFDSVELAEAVLSI